MYKKLLDEIKKGECRGIRSKICIAVKNGRLNKKQIIKLLSELEKDDYGKELFLKEDKSDWKISKSKWNNKYLEELFRQEISYGINKERMLYMADVVKYLHRFDNIFLIGIVTVIVVTMFFVMRGME